MKFTLAILFAFFLFSCTDKTTIKEKDQIIAKLRREIDSLKNPIIRFGGQKINDYSPSSQLTVSPSGKIDSLTAARKLLSFKVWKDISDNGKRDSSINWNKQIYGFYFTWPQLKDFILEVRDLNSNLPQNKKIDGLRVYLGANFDKQTMTFVPDAFLMPTQGYKNYVDLDPDYPKFTKNLSDQDILDLISSDEQGLTDDPVFNKSFPCPSTCP